LEIKGAIMARTYLTEDQVRQIRARVASGLSTYAVAREFEVSQSYVSKVVRRVIRKEVA
jgi:predicted DNA-binding protein YlxM (UPF0122 family)